MEYLCSLRDIRTLVVSLVNEHRLAVIIVVATELTLELHTGAKEAMELFSAGATKLLLNDVSSPMQVFSYFFTGLIALLFQLRNVEVYSKQSLTSSEEKEANLLAILSISGKP